MTLILNSLNNTQAIQISDRRATKSDGSWVDDLNKAFVCFCENARVIVGFTGLAKTTKFDTLSWIGEALMDSLKRNDCLFEPTLIDFTQKATDRFINLPLSINDNTRRLSIVITGYMYNEDPPRAYTWLVSNFDRLDKEEASSRATKQFVLTWMREKRPQSEKFALVSAIGMDSALTQTHLKSYSNFTRYKGEKDILKKGFYLLQTAAKSPISNNYISSNCSAIILSVDPNKPALTKYHSNKGESSFFTPGVMIAGKKEGIYFIREGEISSSWQ